MKKGLFAFLLTFMLGIFTVSAQVENPAQWSYSQKSLGNNEYELVFKAALEPGWHIYSMYTPEGGPMATTVTFGGKVFRTEPLPALEWAYIIAGTSVVLWIGEI